MKKYNQTKVLQQHLTQKKWWTNPKLEELWVTTQLNTKALVLHIFNTSYIILDKHHSQIKVHESRVRESRKEVIQKHDKLHDFIVEISPKSKNEKRKTIKKLVSDMVNTDWARYVPLEDTTLRYAPPEQLTDQSSRPYYSIPREFFEGRRSDAATIWETPLNDSD
jgi:hypothetical protein